MKKNQITIPTDKILEVIFKRCNKKNIKSIYIIGSAARDEITVQTDNEGYISSDIEILVFFKSFITALFYRKKIKIKIDFFRIEILFTHQLFIKLLKTPLIYDLKTSGKLLMGKDIRRKIWITKNFEIPYWEGVKFLYNQLIPFELSLWKLKSNLPINKTEEYFNTKLLIAIGEYIMIKEGCFQSYYMEKLNYFKRKAETNKSFQIIVEALKYKLNINIYFDNIGNFDITCIIVYNILKKINPYINSFKIPPTLKIYNYIKKIKNNDLNKKFSDFKEIQVYKKAFNLLKYYIKDSQKFLNYEREIKNLKNEWEDCLHIHSSYV